MLPELYLQIIGLDNVIIILFWRYVWECLFEKHFQDIWAKSTCQFQIMEEINKNPDIAKTIFNLLKG